MTGTRRSAATLTESDLLAAPVVLRPLRISDTRSRRKIREANRSWLDRWAERKSDEATQPSVLKRFASVIRRTILQPYADAVFSRLEALRGSAAHWVIWYDGRFAGQISVFRIERGTLQSAEVGYWVDERLAGRGIAPTALAIATDHCFQAVGLHRLEANIQPDNVASRRVVDKLGFRDEGTRVGYIRISGAWQDHICYAITADEVPNGLLERWRDQWSARRTVAP